MLRSVYYSIADSLFELTMLGRNVIISMKKYETEITFMFGFFGKSRNMTMDDDKAAAFWTWFEENEKWIIDSISTDAIGVVSKIDEHLKPVFPYLRRALEFEVGFNDGEGEFFFYHFGDSTLERDAEKLVSMMPQSISQRWKFTLDI